MTVNFKNAHLEELYTTGKSKKYKIVPPDVVRKLPLAVRILQQIKVIQDILSALNGTKLLLYNDTVKQYSRKMWEHIGLPAIHYTLFSLDKKLHYNYVEISLNYNTNIHYNLAY